MRVARAWSLLVLVVGAGCHGDIVETGDGSAAMSDGSTPDGATDGGSHCGFRTGMRGFTNRTLTVAGLKRTYVVYLPASMDPTTPMPFVFAFHGYLNSGQEMAGVTLYADLADNENIALAFPDGEAGPSSIAFPWDVKNPGQTVCGWGNDASASGDDLALIDAIEADVSQDQCLDAAHVYSTGFSMGAYLTEHIGCYRSDIRAIAPHSGGTLADLSVCTTGHVPVILFHGTGDSLIADGCDDPTAPSDGGFTASATLWAKKNGCLSTYTTMPVNGAGGGTGQCRLYDGCPADGQVELCTFNGMGHCWAGGSTAGGNFACPTYADATQLEWSFFKQYAW